MVLFFVATILKFVKKSGLCVTPVGHHEDMFSLDATHIFSDSITFITSRKHLHIKETPDLQISKNGGNHGFVLNE